MVVRMLRRRSVKVGRCRMCCRQVVIMPMDVNRAAAVPVGVPMSGEHSDAAAHGRIERVVPDDEHSMFVAVVMILAVPMIVVMVVVFGKTGAVGMCMAVALDRHNDIEAVRLWNVFKGLPKPFPHGERKQLALGRLAPCLQLYPIGRRARQAEPGRDALFIDGQLNDPVAGVDALQLWAMDVAARSAGRISGQERKTGTVTMAMLVTMPLSSCSMQVAPCGCGDPAAEHDQGDAGGCVEEMTEAHSDSDAS